MSAKLNAGNLRGNSPILLAGEQAEKSNTFRS